MSAKKKKKKDNYFMFNSNIKNSILIYDFMDMENLPNNNIGDYIQSIAIRDIWEENGVKKLEFINRENFDVSSIGETNVISNG
ncbi:MAG: hypothetical protein ACK5MQ_14400 [Pikeienuella sp.]